MPPVELDCQAVAPTIDLQVLLRHPPEFTVAYIFQEQWRKVMRRCGRKKKWTSKKLSTLTKVKKKGHLSPIKDKVSKQT